MMTSFSKVPRVTRMDTESSIIIHFTKKKVKLLSCACMLITTEKASSTECIAAPTATAITYTTKNNP